MRFAILLTLLVFLPRIQTHAASPNIVLVMADDQGWGQTGYQGHPLLKTPHLDAMAASGLRMDRFYAAAPVCSPTRSSVLTGRTNERSGVPSHGHSLRLQEKTLAKALRQAGYATGHFGKWHLNGLRGPGVPVLASDTHHPGVFGFQEWLTVTNFFDRDPIMSRKGEFEEFQGDSSEIIVDEALKFITRQVAQEQKFAVVIWYGTPHSPFRAADEDSEAFRHLDQSSRNHYGELVALDRSIGTLRSGLTKLGVNENTLVWYCSDNGGLPKIEPETVGGLRGFKGSVYEGGLRVPGIIQWPEGIPKPRITNFPASTCDIFPTIADIVGLPDSSMLQPQDGMSLRPLLTNELGPREKPLVFRCLNKTALLDNQMKLILLNDKKGKRTYELYDLQADPKEQTNVYSSRPDIARKMTAEMNDLEKSIDDSIAGKDYPEGRVLPENPEPRFWTEVDAYKPFFPQWKNRPEYASRFQPKQKKKAKK